MSDEESRAEGARSAQDTRADLLLRLATLEHELESARAGSAPPLERARHMCALEAELLELVQAVATVEPQLAGERGHLVLAEAADWRAACGKAELEASTEATNEFVDTLIRADAQAWANEGPTLESASAAALFEHLMAASSREREALRRERDDSRPSESYAQGRVPLREALRVRVAAGEPGPATRDAWTELLCDRANEVLTSIDDLSPQRAEQHLRIVQEDLDWHLAEIEDLKSTRRRRIARRVRRLRAEREERLLSARLSERFGAQASLWWERCVVGAIVFVLTLLLVELSLDAELPENARALRWIGWLDTAACVFFLWDFFVKWWMLRGSPGWFRRHFLTDLIPSIPSSVGLEVLRMMRLARMLRFVRVGIRLVRALGFLARGLDRVVRSYGHLLNYNVILYPSPEERARSDRAERSLWTRLWPLQASLNRTWYVLLRQAAPEEKHELAVARLGAWQRAGERGHTVRPNTGDSSDGATPEYLTAEDLLRRLETVTPEEIEGELGEDFAARVSRAVGLFGRAPLRFLPFVGAFVVRVPNGLADSEVVARAARHLGLRLRHTYDRWLWFADLHGTVTPAELVDRVGSALVKRTARPANRLLMFGGLYLFVQALLVVVSLKLLDNLNDSLFSLVGGPVLVLGAVCLLLLALGFWMQRLASKATAFLDQVARAQYLHLTETIKARSIPRDALYFERRVLAPEALLSDADAAQHSEARVERFLEGTYAWLRDGHTPGQPSAGFDPLWRAVILYRDALDGALLGDSDTRTTAQLVGSLALRRMRAESERIGKRELKHLDALDLGREQSGVRGPYLWFTYVSQAVSQACARLLVEYNENAIPLEELPLASHTARARYEDWLAARQREELRSDLVETDERSMTQQVTTTFTALNFLDDDPTRDAAVRARYGDEVLAALRRDRRVLFRRIFATYPLHRLPREERVLNLRQLYHTWMEGGRALFLPLRFAQRTFAQLLRGLAFLGRAVSEIKNPKPWDATEDDEADFVSALRKIDRMHGPSARECMWQRAMVDAEYLGMYLPGAEYSTLGAEDYERDLAFLDAGAEWSHRMHVERRRAQSDVQRLARLLDDGLLLRLQSALGLEPTAVDARAALLNEPERVRALCLAYRADYAGLRAQLSCERILAEALVESEPESSTAPSIFALPGLRLAFRRYWKARGRGDASARAAAWRAVRKNAHGAVAALRTWTRMGPAEARRSGEELAVELMRHPGRITEELVTMRVVQTLSIVDLLNYRNHVWRLGEYGEADGSPHPLLDFDDAVLSARIDVE